MAEDTARGESCWAAPGTTGRRGPGGPDTTRPRPHGAGREEETWAEPGERRIRPIPGTIQVVGLVRVTPGLLIPPITPLEDRAWSSMLMDPTDQPMVSLQ